LTDVLEPVGIALGLGEVTRIDLRQRRLEIGGGDGVDWDALVVALGSRLRRPHWHVGNPLVFSVDTYNEARRLDDHLQAIVRQADQLTVTVVGSGLAGLEVVTALGGRLRELANAAGHDRSTIRLQLVESAARVAPGFSGAALSAIESALDSAGVEVFVGAAVLDVAAGTVYLSDGRTLVTDAAVWTGGLEGNPLAGTVSDRIDRDGRVPVGLDLRPMAPAWQTNSVFVAGDAAAVLLRDGHHSVMSCQHAMPLGRQAGHNAAAVLLGAPTRDLDLADYVTCVDLGPAGGIFTTGWDRELQLSGRAGKQMKEILTERLIYPPQRDRSGGLAAGRGEPPAAAAELVFLTDAI
jgi:NADH dehydrogenase